MSDSPQRLGTGMIIAAWILGLGLLTLFFNQFLEKRYNPNRHLPAQHSQDGVREVTLQRNRNGHYVASGKINGVPVVFFLDTGATTVSIPEPLAQQLKLKRGVAMQMNTANGVITAFSTELDSVTLGAIELRKVRASINPQMQGDDEILLGMSFLRQLEFTQRGNTLILRQYP